jgi:branched-chain amino acid transport system substrate-binding protein
MTRLRNLTRRTLMGGLALLAASVAPVAAQEPIKIGELNSYSRFAAFTVPYRQGWQLALEEVNAAGGILGRPVEVVSRDDGGTTGDAVRVADELVSRENVDLLFGTFASNVGLAVADYANQRNTLFLAAEPLTDALTMEGGNRYTFRFRPNTYMQVKMLVDAVKETGAKRWAIVAPNYEYGQSAAENFKALIKEAIPDAEVVAEQYPALGKIEAGATVAALERARPDAIFNALFGADLVQFVREGTTRGLFEDRPVASLITGEPEWLLPLGDEVPEGWIVTGYPWEQIDTPEHQRFVEAYQARFNETPRMGSLLGYQVFQVIRDMIEKAGSTDTEAMIEAIDGATFETVAGPVTFRDIDNQSTMGTWVGRLAQEGGSGKMVDWRYYDGADYMHPEEEVRAARED